MTWRFVYKEKKTRSSLALQKMLFALLNIIQAAFFRINDCDIFLPPIVSKLMLSANTVTAWLTTNRSTFRRDNLYD